MLQVSSAVFYAHGNSDLGLQTEHFQNSFDLQIGNCAKREDIHRMFFFLHLQPFPTFMYSYVLVGESI